MKDRRVNSNGEIEEWERPKTIPDDFIYDPELDGYLAPGEPADLTGGETFEEFCARIDKIVAEGREEGGPHLISADELFAGRQRNSPPVRRRSPKATNPAQRDLFSDLTDEEDAAAEAQPRSPIATDGDASADDSDDG